MRVLLVLRVAWILTFLWWKMVWANNQEIYMVPASATMPFCICDEEDPLNVDKINGIEINLIKAAMQNTEFVEGEDYYFYCYSYLLTGFYFQDPGENMLLIGLNAIYALQLQYQRRFTQVFLSNGPFSWEFELPKE